MAPAVVLSLRGRPKPDKIPSNVYLPNLICALAKLHNAR